MSGCDRLYALTMGYEYQPREVTVAGGGDEILKLPLTAVLARSPDSGWFLIDTGLDHSVASDPDIYTKWWIWGPPETTGAGNPLRSELEACDVALDEIVGVAISHLHVDHGGGLKEFEGGPPIYIQEDELEFALSETAGGWGYWPPDYRSYGLNWRPLRGDREIAPGITALSTPGHTPGHQSFQIDMAGGDRWVFAFDALVTKENIELDSPVNVGSDPNDTARRQESHDRLMGTRAHARLIPGHCPWTWPELEHPPKFHG